MSPLPVCRQCGKKSDNPICMRCERGDGAKASIPNADVEAHLAAIALERLWDDEICALVDWAFTTVSRNPSDHEIAVAYRRAIASALYHARTGWRWELGSFMGHRGWMWRRSAGPKADAQ